MKRVFLPSIRIISLAGAAHNFANEDRSFAFMTNMQKLCFHPDYVWGIPRNKKCEQSCNLTGLLLAVIAILAELT